MLIWIHISLTIVESSPNHITGVIGLRFDSDDRSDLSAITPCNSGGHQRKLFVGSSVAQSKWIVAHKKLDYRDRALAVK